MACACSKNRKPTGVARPTGNERQSAQRQTTVSTSFEYTAPSGERTVGSKLEASAARVRGGGGSIRPL